MFARADFIVDVELFHDFLTYAVGNRLIHFIGTAHKHIVAEYKTGDAAFELRSRLGDGAVKPLGVIRIREPRHHFETIENHAEKSVFGCRATQRLELCGVEAGVGGIIFMETQKARMRAQS